MRAVIAISNESTVLEDSQIQSWMLGLQAQASLDVIPLWPSTHGGVVSEVSLVFVQKGLALPQDAWRIRIMDDSDQPGALGYHIDEGVPESYVFAKTTLAAGLNPSITVSHELCEMLVDPTTKLVNSKAGTMNVYAREVCDPVEADQLSYEVNGTRVSDFVTPAWFGIGGQAERYDFCAQLHQPFSLAPGGYELIYDPRHGWHQVFAEDSRGNVTLGRPGTSGRTQSRLGEGCTVPAFALEQ